METPSSSPIPVVLVEDHRIVREGTRSLLSRDPDIEVVGEAGDCAGAVRMGSELQPAVMLVDIQLTDGSGIDVIRAIGTASPGTRCVILSAFDDYVYVTEAFAAGASGYLLKTAGASELIGAVHAVSSGATVTDDRISRRLLERWQPAMPTPERLTPREVHVLTLLTRGRSNKQIARELGVGLRTVEGHVSNLLAKCNVRSRTEAALFAVTHHLVATSTAGVDR